MTKIVTRILADGNEWKAIVVDGHVDPNEFLVAARTLVESIPVSGLEDLFRNHERSNKWLVTDNVKHMWCKWVGEPSESEVWGEVDYHVIPEDRFPRTVAFLF